MSGSQDINKISRRSLLNKMCVGFGGLAFNSLISNAFSKADHYRFPNIPARAKRIIFLFMHGGPSHVDLFDYKPELYSHNGKALPFAERKVQFADRGNIFAPPWSFRQVGDCGHWMSELWKHLPEVADDLLSLIHI